jgi:hypothetical protein|tara:strand:+ start:106 stop:231 length:126 start_codon:yes stop_codon:yes gene_type:complete
MVVEQVILHFMVVQVDQVEDLVEELEVVVVLLQKELEIHLL